MSGFKNFILRGNVIDLAVAVVIGGAFGKIVEALVKDLITPLIGLIGGNPDFSFLVVTVYGGKFLVGDFLNAALSFLILAAVIYFFIVMPMNKIAEKIKRGKSVDVTEKTCPECLSLIPLNARRCKFCTAVLAVGDKVPKK